MIAEIEQVLNAHSRRTGGLLAVTGSLATIIPCQIAQISHKDNVMTERSSPPEPRSHPLGSEQRLRALLESSVDGISSIDEQGVIQMVNPATERLFGYPAEELIGQNVKLLMPSPYRDAHDEYLARYRATGEKKIIGIGREVVGSRKDGTQFPLHLSVAEARVSGERVFFGTVTDLTQQVALREAIRESETRLQLFVEHAPAALAMFDPEMRYLVVSRRWKTDYRLGDGELLGRCHYDVFPDIPEHWKVVHRRALEGMTEQTGEDRFVRVSGEVLWIQWEVRPWSRGNGAIGGIVIFSQDITQSKQAEADLRESHEELERLVARL